MSDKRFTRPPKSYYAWDGTLGNFCRTKNVLIADCLEGRRWAAVKDSEVVTAFGKAMLDSTASGEPKTFETTFDGHRCTGSCADFLTVKSAETQLLSSLNLPGNAVILDWGCAIGRHVGKLRELYPGVICHGLDIDDGMLAYCRKTYQKDAFFYHPEQLKADLKFDLILLMGNGLGIFGEEQNVIARLKKLKQMLTPNGILLFETGNPMGHGYSTVTLENHYQDLQDGPFLWGGSDRAWVESTMRELGFKYEFQNMTFPQNIFFYVKARKI